MVVVFDVLGRMLDQLRNNVAVFEIRRFGGDWAWLVANEESLLCLKNQIQAKDRVEDSGRGHWCCRCGKGV